jgi:hypothetical protein
MSAQDGEIPLLAQWQATLGTTTAPQYRSQVRSFFAARADFRPSTVGRQELVGYCAGFEGQQKRWLVMGALDRYFEFLEQHDPGQPHPAPGLAKKVAAFRERRALQRGLEKSGVTVQRAASLRWRDVARDLVGPRNLLPPKLDAQVRTQLVQGLLEKLRSASPDTVADVLDLAVLD